MIRKASSLYFAVVLFGSLVIGGCDRFFSSEDGTQRLEEKRLQDQNERAALVEKMKAVSIERQKKQEPIKNLQKQIDALDQQISYARSRGIDWRPSEKTQEALEAKKEELEKQ